MAGTIDQLNFEVIINDVQFKKKIDAMKKMASDFNTSLSNILNVQAVSQELVVSNRKRNQMETDNVRAIERQNREKMRTEALEKKLTAQVEKTSKGYQSQSRILSELKNYALGYLSVQGAGQLLSSLIRVTGEFEMQKTTLAAMLGDLNKAEQVITKIQGLAVESPFQFKELTTYAKQLSAFSVPAEELYDTTKMLADVSAGLGVGMDRIVLAYGQVRSAAFLRGQEVRQFTEAGIPILDELAKQFTELEGRAVSTGEVFDKISARLVPFEMVAKVFKDMTSEGGKFYNMQEVQAETLQGKISNLKDAYEVMLNEIGKGQSENLKGAVDWVRGLMQNYEQTGRTLVELVAAYGVYKTALMGVTAATGTFTLANHKLLSSLVSAGKWVATNPYVLIAAGLTAAGYAVYKAATGLQGYEKIQRSVNESISKYNVESAKEVANLDALYAKLNMAAKGSEEYEKARKSIYTEYASYISQLKEEGVAVNDLAAIYDNLKTKIEESVKARFRSTEARNITQTYEKEMDTIYKRFEHMVTRYQRMAKRELTYDEKEGLWQYILGNEEAWNRAEVEGLRNIVNADKYNQSQVFLIKKNVQDIVSAYQEGKEKLKNVLGEDTTEPTTVTNPFVYNLDDGGGKGKSPAQKAIEEQIKSVQKLQDAYEKLMPYLNEVQMKSTLKALFPNIEAGVIDSLDFNAELERLAGELEKFDEDAAQRLRDTIGKDVAGVIVDSFKAVEQYKKMLDSWLGEDFNLSGKGVSFDISKIVSNLNSEYAKIDQKRVKALDLLNKAQMGDEKALKKVREVYGEEVWEKYVAKGSEVIEELARKEREAAKQTADEKIRDLASKYINEQKAAKNIDLTDFEDKTIAQIKEQIDRLKKIRAEAQDEANKAMAEVAMGNLDEGQYAKWQMLKDVLEQLGIIIEDTGEELDKKVYENLQNSLSAVSDLGGKLSDLGSNLELPELENFGKQMSEIADGASSIFQALQAKDTVALIANIVSIVYTSIANMITRAYEQQRLLNEASKEYAERLVEIRREAYSGIFGTDEMGLAAENAEILAEVQEDYQGVLDKFNKSKIQAQKISGGRSWKKQSVADIMGDISESQGWDLYLENGELNIAALESYYDAYSERLTKKQRALVQDIIDAGNAVDDAAAQQAEYLTDIFSQAADTIASDMVDAFIESGDAAVDMRDYVSDAAKQMAADLIKTLYLLPVMNQYAENLKAIASDSDLTADEKTAQALAIFQTALAEIDSQSGAINDTLKKLDEYFETGEEEGTTDLGDGIKGITEDQANLLASYLNAIRADVSYSKTLWQRMDTNLQRIADMFVSSPTLMEYQAQIAANTYDTAVATQTILARLEGLITYDSGDASVRVSS